MFQVSESFGKEMIVTPLKRMCFIKVFFKFCPRFRDQIYTHFLIPSVSFSFSVGKKIRFLSWWWEKPKSQHLLSNSLQWVPVVANYPWLVTFFLLFFFFPVAWISQNFVTAGDCHLIKLLYGFGARTVSVWEQMSLSIRRMFCACVESQFITAKFRQLLIFGLFLTSANMYCKHFQHV